MKKPSNRSPGNRHTGRNDDWSNGKARPFANKNIFMYCICFEVFYQYAPENGK